MRLVSGSDGEYFEYSGSEHIFTRSQGNEFLVWVFHCTPPRSSVADFSEKEERSSSESVQEKTFSLPYGQEYGLF